MQYETIIFFFFNDTATTEIYTLSLHDALPIWDGVRLLQAAAPLSGAWQAERRGDRPAGGDAGWDPHREGLSLGAQRAPRVRPRRAQSVPQRRDHDDWGLKRGRVRAIDHWRDFDRDDSHGRPCGVDRKSVV